MSATLPPSLYVTATRPDHGRTAARRLRTIGELGQESTVLASAAPSTRVGGVNNVLIALRQTETLSRAGLFPLTLLEFKVEGLAMSEMIGLGIFSTLCLRIPSLELSSNEKVTDSFLIFRRLLQAVSRIERVRESG
jgi:hypothetical protein